MTNSSLLAVTRRWSVKLELIGALTALFFFKQAATTEIYTLSLHDALPISSWGGTEGDRGSVAAGGAAWMQRRDRKSTRLNFSHRTISYAVFCLKKKIEMGGLAEPEAIARYVGDRLREIFDVEMAGLMRLNS